VTVTDANGETATGNWIVTPPAVLALSATVTNDSGSGNGAIDLTATGGTPSYSYLWSDTEMTQDISGLSADTYSVTVEDAHFCTVTGSWTVVSTAPTIYTVTYDGMRAQEAVSLLIQIIIRLVQQYMLFATQATW